MPAQASQHIKLIGTILRAIWAILATKISRLSSTTKTPGFALPIQLAATFSSQPSSISTHPLSTLSTDSNTPFNYTLSTSSTVPPLQNIWWWVSFFRPMLHSVTIFSTMPPSNQQPTSATYSPSPSPTNPPTTILALSPLLPALRPLIGLCKHKPSN